MNVIPADMWRLPWFKTVVLGGLAVGIIMGAYDLLSNGISAEDSDTVGSGSEPLQAVFIWLFLTYMSNTDVQGALISFIGRVLGCMLLFIFISFPDVIRLVFNGLSIQGFQGLLLDNTVTMLWVVGFLVMYHALFWLCGEWREGVVGQCFGGVWQRVSENKFLEYVIVCILLFASCVFVYILLVN